MNVWTKLALTAVGLMVLLWLTSPVSPASAQTACATTASGETICDPTSFHVSSPTATGSDPVLLNDSNTFTISEVGNHSINDPIRVYFIEPLGAALPTITGATGVSAGGAFTIGPTSTATAQAFDTTNNTFDGPTVTISSGQDFGKQVGLGDASVSYANFQTEYLKLGLTVPTTFQVEDAVFNVPGNGFNSDLDFLTVDGKFGLGTIIAPLAIDITTDNHGKVTVTAFDTAWTNAGFVNQLSTTVPEPRTWVLMGIGFAALGYTALRRRRAAALA
jgi:hypothetical protein